MMNDVTLLSLWNDFSQTENDIILLQEILTYMHEALARITLADDPNQCGTDVRTCRIAFSIFGGFHCGDIPSVSVTCLFVGSDIGAQRLWDYLKLVKALHAMRRRIGDMKKNIVSAKHELKCLQDGINNIESLKIFCMQAEIRSGAFYSLFCLAARLSLGLPC